MKRLIFTLLYDDGNFILSRNFRRQVVGKLSWILKNYNLEEVTNFIDELIVLDISKNKNLTKFCKILNIISKKTFIPLVAGGGIKNLDQVNKLLDNGADKIVINSLFHEKPHVCKLIADKYGSQFIVGCVDYQNSDSKKNTKVFIPSRKIFSDTSIDEHIKNLINFGVGEILLQSIDRDGTGYGLDYKLVNKFKKIDIPIILMGGVGNYSHIVKGFRMKNCNAVSTANLFNFVADEFNFVRQKLHKYFDLPNKSKEKIQNLKKNV